MDHRSARSRMPDPDRVLQDAYAIQTYNIERRVASSRVIRGRKVGLTSRPMQELLGVSEPDFGVLLDDMFVEDGDEIPLETMLQPRVEAEMAFVIGADLAGPGVTTSNALTAIAGVSPAIEIVDSRIADWKIRLIDTVADNASSGKLVIGGKLTKVTDFDLRLAGMVMTRNGAGHRHRRGRGRAGQSGPLRRLAGQQAGDLRRVAARPGEYRAPGRGAPDGAGPARRCLPGRVRLPRRGHRPVQ